MRYRLNQYHISHKVRAPLGGIEEMALTLIFTRIKKFFINSKGDDSDATREDGGEPAQKKVNGHIDWQLFKMLMLNVSAFL